MVPVRVLVRRVHVDADEVLPAQVGIDHPREGVTPVILPRLPLARVSVGVAVHVPSWYVGAPKVPLDVVGVPGQTRLRRALGVLPELDLDVLALGGIEAEPVGVHVVLAFPDVDGSDGIAGLQPPGIPGDFVIGPLVHCGHVGRQADGDQGEDGYQEYYGDCGESPHGYPLRPKQHECWIATD